MLQTFVHGTLVNHVSPCPPHREEGGSMGPASPECCCWQTHALSLNREPGPSPATPFSAGVQGQADAQAPSCLPLAQSREVYSESPSPRRCGAERKVSFSVRATCSKSKNSLCFLVPRVLCMCQLPLGSVQALSGQAEPFIAGMSLRSGHRALHPGKAIDNCSVVAAACSQHGHSSLCHHSSLLQGSAWGTEGFGLCTSDKTGIWARAISEQRTL